MLETKNSQVRIADIQELEKVKAIITLAFSADPFNRWYMPNAAVYLKYFPEIVEAFGGRAFEHSSAYVTNNGRGVALWLPPGIEPDFEHILPIIERVVDEKIKDDLFQVIEQMDKMHPKEPTWYLPLIGVDPSDQNGGQGTLLLKDALKHIDNEGLPAYLESSNPRNLSLYERFGFKVIGEIQVGDSPRLYPMIREAQNH